MFFSVITKNLNWDILTKNLLTFKRRDWVKDRGSLKNAIIRGKLIKGKLPKKRAWTVCRCKG